MDWSHLRRIAAAVCLSLLANVAVSKPARLLLDINQGASSNPTFGFSVGGVVMFAANDGGGVALWRSDGTTAGTQKLGAGAPVPTRTGVGRWGQQWARLGDIVIYTGLTTTGAAELWRTDGTAAGTTLLLDLAVPPTGFGTLVQGSNPGTCGVGYLTVGNRVFYGVTVGGRGKLFRTDGTVIGTVEVGEFPSQACVLGAHDGEVYFALGDPGSAIGSQLWRSNGQVGGSSPILDETGGQVQAPPNMVDMAGDSFFFTRSPLQTQAALWRLKAGETVPRVVVKRTWPTALNVASLMAGVVGNTVLFLDSELIDGTTLTQKMFRSDGTQSGTYALSTVAVTNTARPPGILFGSRYAYAGPVDLDRVRPVVHGRNNGRHVFLRIAANGSQTSPPPAYLLFDSQLYLAVMNIVSNVHTPDLWRTNGTASGTARVTDVPSFERGLTATDLVAVGNRLLFTAYSNAEGWELWMMETDSVASPAPPTGGGISGGGDSGGGALGWLELVALAVLAVVVWQRRHARSQISQVIASARVILGLPSTRMRSRSWRPQTPH